MSWDGINRAVIPRDGKPKPSPLFYEKFVVFPCANWDKSAGFSTNKDVKKFHLGRHGARTPICAS